MGRPRSDIGELERRALLGLWSVPGVGPRSLDLLYRELGALGPLLEQEPARWLPGGLLAGAADAALRSGPCVAQLADRTEAAAKAGDMAIAFTGDTAYPRNLVDVEDAPPLLFYRGNVSAPRRRVAMVGCRHPDQQFLPFASKFAEETARLGMGVVSGGAIGVDRHCHLAALKAGEETLAFLGSAIDVMDAAQSVLAPGFLEGAGVFYSELPPGVRANPTTFPRRNRLISGASDVVLVLRAGVRSGALHTAEYALKQGRPLLAIPGDIWNENAAGCNALIRDRGARLCLHPLDVATAAGLMGVGAERPGPPATEVPWGNVSPAARQVYELLQGVKEFEEMLGGTTLSSGALTSALCELELMGLVVQRPGKRYEKI